MYRLVFENDRVRILDVKSKPGDKTALHSHPDVVAVGITDGKYRFAGPGGEAMELELKSGQAVFVEAVEHTTENVGTSESHTILVELK